jgi:cytochrome c-type protein NapB
MDVQEGQKGSTRGLQVMAVGVIAAAFVGFFVGLRPAPAPERAAAAAPTPWEGAPVAPSWRELRERPREGLVEAELATLPRAVDRLAPAGQSAEARLTALTQGYMGLRAYDGAPPRIPHAVPQRGPLGCLSCHAEGLVIGDKVAPAISHAHLSACTQCHAPSQGGPPLRAPLEPSVGENAFAGLAPAGVGGERAWPGAPPQIPHSTWMREQCLSCHEAHQEAERAENPRRRRSCVQCHAPSAALEQRAFAPVEARDEPR